MFIRNIEKRLLLALSRNPVTLLNGARQIGKSTLALKVAKDKNYHYVNLDKEIVYLAAKSDPEGFINNLPKPVIIDEIQKVPELFLAIKQDVDQNRIPGRYLLTGSANPLLIPRLGDSLAGRMGIIELMPLSQGEIEGVEEGFIDWLFSGQPPRIFSSNLSRTELHQKILTGGYPNAVLSPDEDARENWLQDYIGLIINRDVRDLAQIEKITELPDLLKLLAIRAAGLLNVADVSRDCQLIAQTVHRYFALLETVFILHLQQSWHSNLTLRIVKSPKIYLLDSGLLSYLMGMNSQRITTEAPQAGKILENFIVEELRKQSTWSDTRPQLYHFRTSNGQNEVDIVLESRAGDLIGIEVKHSERITESDLKGLRYLSEKTGDKFKRGIILYTGQQVVPFGDNLWAMPVSSLWKTQK